MSSIAATALGPVQQRYLLEARQMQALSFAVHIPLVCFGIAFPAMVLFVEWLYARSGDQLYLTLARRWTRVMVALFAVGVITGTILSFEMGLLWPNFTGTFGSVFGLGFAIEGFSFFAEAIFIGIYVYGWSRLSRRAHFASGIPVVISGFTGSWMVISVNAWMNHPSGFRIDRGRVVYGIPLPHMLSLLAFHSADARVQGLDAVAPADRPPVNVVRFAFQTMVGIGTFLAALSVAYLVVRIRRKRLPESVWFYRALV